MPGPISKSFEMPCEEYVTCVFCGMKYSKGTPTCKHEKLYKHIFSCKKHPLYITNKAFRETLLTISEMLEINYGKDKSNQFKKQLINKSPREVLEIVKSLRGELKKGVPSKNH